MLGCPKVDPTEVGHGNYRRGEDGYIWKVFSNRQGKCYWAKICQR